MRRLLLIAMPLGLWLNCVWAQTTQPGENAAVIYRQAAGIVEKNNDAGIYPPSSSNLVYAGYPPYPGEWHRLEEVDFRASAPARKLTHQAALIGQADWQAITSQAREKWSMSPLQGLAVDGELLNPLRGLANVLADAVLWQHEQKDDVAAIETMRDLWRLAAAVQRIENSGSCLLTGLAIQDLDLERLEVVTSSIALTKDQHDAKSVQATAAQELIGELMDHPDPKTEGANFNHVYGAAMKGAPASLPGAIVEIINSVDAERDLAAMSLACHLYRLDANKWPRSSDDIRKYLPRIPIDPFGDGKQTLGYALIKGGLPDGSDRPLVCSRHRMKDGLSFRVDLPEYCDYAGDGGQFRDAQEPGGFSGFRTPWLDRN